MGQTPQRPESRSLHEGSALEWDEVVVLHTSLIPECMPIKGPTKQSELFFGFESKIRSRRYSLLVQPASIHG